MTKRIDSRKAVRLWRKLWKLGDDWREVLQLVADELGVTTIQVQRVLVNRRVKPFPLRHVATYDGKPTRHMAKVLEPGALAKAEKARAGKDSDLHSATRELMGAIDAEVDVVLSRIHNLREQQAALREQLQQIGDRLSDEVVTLGDLLQGFRKPE